MVPRFRQAARVLVLVLMAACAGRAASAQSVDEIVAKNLQAHGGVEKIRAIQTIKRAARLRADGLDVAFTTYGKRPNLARKEVSVGTQQIVSAFDGTSGWIRNPLVASAARPLGGADLDALRQESEFDLPLVDYKARGYVIALAGTEDQQGRKVHHLKLSGAGRPARDCYLDAETGLETRIVTVTAAGTIEVRFADFRDVQGVQLPFSVQTLQNGSVVADVAVQSIELNVPIDDGLFKLSSGAL